MDNGSNVIGNVYRILIVDDTESIRNSLKRRLDTTKFPFSCEIYISDDGENAFELIKNMESQNQGVHLVLTDYGMPKMNGYRLMRMIRKYYKNIKIILISGFPRKEICGEFDGFAIKGDMDFSQMIVDDIIKHAADYFAEKVESIL
jgi:CheY-like chemotaxis protein